MSNQRFIELSSSYRNRTIYPDPAEFEVSFVAHALRNDLIYLVRLALIQLCFSVN